MIPAALVVVLWLLPVHDGLPTSETSASSAVFLGKAALFVAAVAALIFIIHRLAGAQQGQLTWPYRWGIGSLVVLIGAGLVAWLVLWQTAGSALREQLQQLTAIVDLQSRAAIEYQGRLRANVAMISQNVAVVDRFRRWQATGSAADRESLREALLDLTAGQNYVTLQILTPDGQLLLDILGELPDPDPKIAVYAARAEQQRGVVLVPIHEVGGALRFGYAAPLRTSAEGPASGGILLLGLDARALFTFFEHWPVESRTGETLLTRRLPSDDYLVLGPLRFDPAPPLSRILPASAVAFGGDMPEGRGEGISVGYTGQRVLGVVRPLPGTSAVLAAQVSEADALAPAFATAWMAGAVVFAVGTGVLAVAFAASQRNEHRRALQAARQEAALRDAGQLFRATFDHVAVGIAHIDLEGRILRINRRACEMLGATAEEVINSSAYDLWRRRSHADLGSARQTFQQLLQGEIDHLEIEHDIARDDGTLLWLRSVMTRVRGAEGPADYLVSVSVDITERHAAEERLRLSEERFKLAMEGAEEGLWDADLVAGTVYISPNGAKMLGYDSKPMIRPFTEWYQLAHPADRGTFEKVWRRVREGTQQSFSIELRVLRRDGTYVDTLIRGAAAKGSEGSPVRAVGTLLDVSELKQTERRLRLASTVFSSAQEAIVVTELDGTISAVNPAFCLITGYTERDVIGKNMHILQSGRQDAAFYTQFWKALKETGEWRGEIINRRGNGELYPEMLNIRAVRDANGTPVNYVGSFTDTSSLRRSQSELERVSNFDPLTALPNRVLLLRTLERIVGRSPEGSVCALLFIDLDRFKAINDSFGHAVGDEVLVEVAERLKSVLGSRGMVGRYGGDEFLALLSGLPTPREAAAHAAAAVLAALTPAIQVSGDRTLYVGASIGIALCPRDGRDGQHLLRHADIALAHAKADGRGEFVFYEEGMAEAADARFALEEGLRHALSRGEMAIHYQPQIDVATGEMCGVEALLRWESPTGPVSPAEFVPIAEETGLIMEIGDFVLNSACRQMKAWRDAGLQCGPIAVNISARQFYQPDLVGRIQEILAQTGLDSAYLEIEITESVLMTEATQAAAKLQELRSMGVRVALDDFGTGFSSLDYVRRFPVTRLKIDQSFVRELPASTADSQIVIAIVALAKALSFEVIAEGVERPAQLAFLTRAGCHQIQGFLFSPPLEADALARYVHRHQAAGAL